MISKDHLAEIQQIQEIANFADYCSTKIYQYLVENPEEENAGMWRNLMRSLDDAAAQTDALVLQIFGALNSKSLKTVVDATSEAKKFTEATKEIKDALKVFASFLNLAGSLIGGAGVTQVLDSAKALSASAKNKKG